MHLVAFLIPSTSWPDDVTDYNLRPTYYYLRPILRNASVVRANHPLRSILLVPGYLGEMAD